MNLLFKKGTNTYIQQDSTLLTYIVPTWELGLPTLLTHGTECQYEFWWEHI